VFSNYEAANVLVKVSWCRIFQGFRRAHARKIMKNVYHVVCLRQSLENNFKFNLIAVTMWTTSSGSRQGPEARCCRKGSDILNHRWKDICRPPENYQPLCFTELHVYFYPNICISYFCMEVRNLVFKTPGKSTIIWSMSYSEPECFCISTTLVSKENQTHTCLDIIKPDLMGFISVY
jgi:hypothetical protein